MKKKAELVTNQFPTVKEFAISMNYDVCLNKYRGIKMRDCQRDNFVKMRELKQIYSVDGVCGYLQAWLISLSEFFNIKDDRGKLAGYQVEEIAMNILEDFSFLNLPELTILFRNIRKGKYFSIYGRISGAEIYQAVQEFAKERGAEILKIEEKKAKERNNQMPTHERARLIKKGLAKYNAQKEKQSKMNTDSEADKEATETK